MISLSVFCLLLGAAAVSAETFCTTANIEMVGRVVFGEARGESATGQLAVAWTIVNRVHHSGYPNTLYQVVYQKYNSHYQYNTLDLASHNNDWANAKAHHSATYQHAITAARGALCNEHADPTTCATDYCARDPCSATDSNRYYQAYHKVHIGHHYFVCRRSVSG